MYRHVKSYEVRYTDSDIFDVLKPSTMLSFLQESACLSADELGFGYADIAPKNIGFILSNWYFSLYRPVKLGETLRVDTWPLTPKHVIFNRDFELFSRDEKVGVATSRWCMIDTKSYNFLDVSAYFSKDFFDDFNTERAVDFKNWKIEGVSAPSRECERTMGYSDCDHYFHVNNSKYADFVMDLFDMDEMEKKYVSAFQISYVKQCKIGERLTLKRENRDGYVLVEGATEDELKFQTKITLEDK